MRVLRDFKKNKRKEKEEKRKYSEVRLRDMAQCPKEALYAHYHSSAEGLSTEQAEASFDGKHEFPFSFFPRFLSNYISHFREKF